MISFPDFLEALGPAPSSFLNEREPRVDEFGVVRTYSEYRDEVKAALRASTSVADPVHVTANFMPFVGKLCLYCWYIGIAPEAGAEYIVYLAVPAGIPWANCFAYPSERYGGSDRSHGVATTPLPEPLP